MRLFLDANILFSAAHSPEGGAHDLIMLSEAGYCELLTSQHAIFEADRNLTLKSPSGAEAFHQVLKTVHRLPDAGPGLFAWAVSLGLPESDAPILAAAAAAEANLLVTGDRKHFGHLYGSTVGRVRVATPVEALEMVLAS